MKKYYILLILIYIFLTILPIAVCDREDDTVDVEDFEDWRFIDEGDHWYIELLSDSEGDYVYDIVAKSHDVDVDFIITDLDEYEKYRSGADFNYDSKKSSLDEESFEGEVEMKKDSEMVIFIIDNSDKVDGGANSYTEAEIDVYISPRKDFPYSVDEMRFILSLVSLLALISLVIPIGIIIKIQKNKENAFIEKHMQYSSDMDGEFKALKRTKFQEQKDKLLQNVASSSNESFDLIRESYTKSQYLLTTRVSEKSGLNYIIFSLIGCYIGAFWYVVIKSTYYVGGQPFDNYIIVWSGLFLLINGTIGFLIGINLLKRAYEYSPYKKACKKRIHLFFLSFLIAQLCAILYTTFIVEVFLGPWGGYLFPVIMIIIVFCSYLSVLNSLDSKPVMITEQSLASSSSTTPSFSVPSYQRPGGVLRPITQSQPRGFLPDSSYERKYVFCPQCGHKLSIENNFCSNCGNQMK